MKLHLIEIRHDSGDVVSHVIDQDGLSAETLCGHGIDWRLDNVVGKLTDPADAACPTCRARADDKLD